MNYENELENENELWKNGNEWRNCEKMEKEK